MIERHKSKQEIRKEMEQEIREFLDGGGEIATIKRGVSGKDDNTNLNQHIPFNNGEKQTRTLLTDTIKTLEERKQKKKKSTPKKTQHQPKKRIIYDDFNEPIREIWE